MSQRNCRGLNSLSSNISPTPTVCMAWFWSKALRELLPNALLPLQAASISQEPGKQKEILIRHAGRIPTPVNAAMPSAPRREHSSPPPESWSPLHSRPVERCQCLTDSGEGGNGGPDSGSARCRGVNLTARLGPFRCHKWCRIGRNNLRHINDVKV